MTLVAKREKYLDKLIARKWNSMAKVVTGVRRSGKSFLLFNLFVNHLLEEKVPEDHIIAIDLESRENAKFRDADALRAECDRVKEEFSLTRKRLIDRMQDESESLGANYVYLNILQESQELISTLRHLLRAARNFQTEVSIF